MTMDSGWFVYIVQCSDESFYTGVTTNLEARIEAHNGSSSGAKYTRGRRPVRLVYSYLFASRSEAQKEESRIKKLSRNGKRQLLSSCHSSFDEVHLQG